MSIVKVLHFLPLFDTGGTEKLVLDIHNLLDPDRFESRICSFFAGEYDRWAAGISPFRHILVPEQRKTSRRTYIKALGFCKRLVQLNTLIRDEGVDILHTHHLGPLLHVFVLKRTTCRNLPWIHTEHNVPDLREGYERRIFRWTKPLSGPDLITAVSENVCHFLTERYNVPLQKLRFIPNGVDIDRFSILTGRDEVRHALHLNADDEIVGCIGNLRKEKNHELVIRACATLFGRRPRMKLILCGDGALRSQLEVLARNLGVSERIQFLGYRFDIPKMLRAIDVFCLPSMYEGMPLSILEAWAAGRPVVATRVIGIQDLVKDGVDGMLVSPDGLGEMANAIQSLLDSKPLQEKLTRNGFGRVSEEYALQAMVARYATLYESLTTD